MDIEKKNDEIDEILKEVREKSSEKADTPPQNVSAGGAGGEEDNVPPDEAHDMQEGGESAAAETPEDAGQTDVTAAYNDTEKEEKALNKKLLAVIVAVIVLVAAAAGVYFGIFYNKYKGEENTSAETTRNVTESITQVSAANPLTGESDFNESALNTRYLSVVVENSADARPQYNMDSADIIFEAEVEGGITRMLWVYADISSIPSQVGPVRSARPVLVELSELFDSVFVHYGGSHSASNYVGGYDVIANDNVDDVDGMSVSSCFRRTSDKVSPHNAVLLGGSIVGTIESKGYSTSKSSGVTQFGFYDELTAVSDAVCSSVSVTISSVTDTHTLTYDSESGLYTNSSDYGGSVSFSNVIVLYANTSYVSTSSYTYCLYNLTSGGGKLVSGGSALDINWNMNGNVLTLTDSSGQEIKLNKGKSWIAVASANNGGSVVMS